MRQTGEGLFLSKQSGARTYLGILDIEAVRAKAKSMEVVICVLCVADVSIFHKRIRTRGGRLGRRDVAAYERPDSA